MQLEDRDHFPVQIKLLIHVLSESVKAQQEQIE